MAIPALLAPVLWGSGIGIAGFGAAGAGLASADGNNIAEKVGNLYGQITGGLAAGGVAGSKEGIKAFLQEFGVEEDQMAGWTKALGDAFFSVLKDIMDGGDFSWGDIGDMDINEVIAHNKGQFWDELLSNAKNQGLDIDVDATVEGITELDAANIDIPGRQGLIDALQSDDMSLTPAQIATLEQLSKKGVSQEPVSADFKIQSASEAIDSVLREGMQENYGLDIDPDNIRRAMQELQSRDLESGVDLDDLARKASEGTLEEYEIHMLETLEKEGQTTGLTHTSQEHLYYPGNVGNGRDVIYDGMKNHGFIRGGTGTVYGETQSSGAIIHQHNREYGDSIAEGIQQQYGIELDMDAVAETMKHFENQGLSTGMSIEEINRLVERGELSQDQLSYLKALEEGPEAFQEQSGWNPLDWGDGRDVEPTRSFESSIKGQLGEIFKGARTPDAAASFNNEAPKGADQGAPAVRKEPELNSPLTNG